MGPLPTNSMEEQDFNPLLAHIDELKGRIVELEEAIDSMDLELNDVREQRDNAESKYEELEEALRSIQHIADRAL